jgi:hypothetical protein
MVGTLTARSQDRLDRKMDFKTDSSWYYHRTDFDCLLRTLLSNPQIKIGFTTSLIKSNSHPLASAMFKKSKLKEFKDRFFKIFDREYQQHDEEGPY